jgi:hypothetical protein
MVGKRWNAHVLHVERSCSRRQLRRPTPRAEESCRMFKMKQRWVVGLMLSLGTVLVGSSWAREPSAAAVVPALGELELRLEAGAEDPNAARPSFALAVRGTSAGSVIRHDVVLDAAQSSRVRLQLPPGAYAIALSSASLPDPTFETAPLPQVVETSRRWLALPAAEVVLVAAGRRTRARVVVASTGAPATLAAAFER